VVAERVCSSEGNIDGPQGCRHHRGPRPWHVHTADVGTWEVSSGWSTPSPVLLIRRARR